MRHHKAISLILSACLLGNSILFSNSFTDSLVKGFTSKYDDIFGGKGFGNFTEFSKESNADGNSYYNFPSGSYRFKDSTTSAPWVDFQPPTLEAGCNGLSFNLGFASLVDFDDIASDIGNAAGAIVYGILIALINSMPTINQILNQIKSTVQYIQNLLRNACNFSQTATQNMFNNLKQKARERKASGNTESIGITDYLLTSQDYLDSATSKIQGSLNDIKKKINKTLTGSGGTAGGGEKNQISEEFIKASIPIFRISLLPSIISKDKSVVKMDLNDKKLYKLQEIEIEADNTSTFDFSSKKNQYLLLVALIGDRDGMSNDELNLLKNDGGSEGQAGLDAIMELIQNGKISNSYSNFLNRYAETKYKQQKQGDTGTPEYNTNPVMVGGTNRTTLFNVILNGDQSQTLRISNRWIALAKVTAKNKQTYTMLRTLEATKASDSDVRIRWEGLVKESAKAIYCTIQKTNNASNGKLAELVLSANKVNTTPTCGDSDYALIAPNWTKFINEMILMDINSQNYQNVINIKNNDETRIKSLSRILAMQNALSYADFLMDSLRNTLEQDTKSPEINKNGESELDILNKIIDDFKLKIQKEFQEKIKELNEIKTLLESTNPNNKKEASVGSGK